MSFCEVMNVVKRFFSEVFKRHTEDDAEQVVILTLASHGMLDEIPTAEQRAKTSAFVRQFHADVSGTMDAITATGKIGPEQVDTILAAWNAFAGGESHAVQ